MFVPKNNTTMRKVSTEFYQHHTSVPQRKQNKNQYYRVQATPNGIISQKKRLLLRRSRESINRSTCIRSAASPRCNRALLSKKFIFSIAIAVPIALYSNQSTVRRRLKHGDESAASVSAQPASAAPEPAAPDSTPLGDVIVSQITNVKNDDDKFSCQKNPKPLGEEGLRRMSMFICGGTSNANISKEVLEQQKKYYKHNFKLATGINQTIMEYVEEHTEVHTYNAEEDEWTKYDQPNRGKIREQIREQLDLLEENDNDNDEVTIENKRYKLVHEDKGDVAIKEIKALHQDIRALNFTHGPDEAKSDWEIFNNMMSSSKKFNDHYNMEVLENDRRKYIMLKMQFIFGESFRELYELMFTTKHFENFRNINSENYQITLGYNEENLLLLGEILQHFFKKKTKDGKSYFVNKESKRRGEITQPEKTKLIQDIDDSLGRYIEDMLRDSDGAVDSTDAEDARNELAAIVSDIIETFERVQEKHFSLFRSPLVRIGFADSHKDHKPKTGTRNPDVQKALKSQIDSITQAKEEVEKFNNIAEVTENLQEDYKKMLTMSEKIEFFENHNILCDNTNNSIMYKKKKTQFKEQVLNYEKYWEKVLGTFKVVTANIKEAMKAEEIKSELHMGPNKKWYRVAEKCKSKNDTNMDLALDIVRCTFVVDDILSLYNAIDITVKELTNAWKAADRTIDDYIVYVKDRIYDEHKPGYFDILLLACLPDGTWVEIQYHSAKALHYKESHGHKVYDVTRTTDYEQQYRKKIGLIENNMALCEVNEDDDDRDEGVYGAVKEFFHTYTDTQYLFPGVAGEGAQFKIFDLCWDIQDNKRERPEHVDDTPDFQVVAPPTRRAKRLKAIENMVVNWFEDGLRTDAEHMKQLRKIDRVVWETWGVCGSSPEPHIAKEVTKVEGCVATRIQKMDEKNDKVSTIQWFITKKKAQEEGLELAVPQDPRLYNVTWDISHTKFLLQNIMIKVCPIKEILRISEAHARSLVEKY